MIFAIAFARLRQKHYFCTLIEVNKLQMNGIVAQLVEQRTENPCVGGSKPSDTTTSKALRKKCFFFER